MKASSGWATGVLLLTIISFSAVAQEPLQSLRITEGGRWPEFKRGAARAVKVQGDFAYVGLR